MTFSTSENYVGVGLYTIPEAARLTSINTRSVSRWVKGYTYNYNNELVFQPPVIEVDLPKIEGQVELSFLDLLELRFIKKFVEFGVPLQNIRKSIVELSKIVDSRHPLSTQDISTDGRALFLQIIDEEGKPLLYELAKRNYAFFDVVFPNLIRGISYSKNRHAESWEPDPQSKIIIIDPRIAFGQPIIKGTRIPTTTLAEACMAEGSSKEVAKWYSVDEKAVHDAVQFESRLAA